MRYLTGSGLEDDLGYHSQDATLSNIYKRFLTLYRTQERTQLCRHVRISTNTRFQTVYFRFTGGVRSGHLAETLTVPRRSLLPHN